MSAPNAVQQLLATLLTGDLLAWHGLPPLRVDELTATLGAPVIEEEAVLGWFPAIRTVYEVDPPVGRLAAFSRNGLVVMLEPLAVPALPPLEQLGTPSTILPHELLADDAYIHEYVYGGRGLVLSIADPFDRARPRLVVRCRGVRPISDPAEFGPELYRSADDETAWNRPFRRTPTSDPLSSAP